MVAEIVQKNSPNGAASRLGALELSPIRRFKPSQRWLVCGLQSDAPPSPLKLLKTPLITALHGTKRTVVVDKNKGSSQS
jgi:hypothetical protein